MNSSERVLPAAASARGRQTEKMVGRLMKCWVALVYMVVFEAPIANRRAGCHPAPHFQTNVIP